MLSIVLPIAAPLPFSTTPNPSLVAWVEDTGLTVTRVGRAHFRLSGRAVNPGESRFVVHLMETKICVPVLPGDGAHQLYQKLERLLPEGYRAFARSLDKGSLDISLIQLETAVTPVPSVQLSILDDLQSASAHGPNGFEIVGLAGCALSETVSEAQLTVDGKTLSIRLRRGMTPAETARSLLHKLPAGYQASLETTRVPGAPATVIIVRGAGIDKAAA